MNAGISIGSLRRLAERAGVNPDDAVREAKRQIPAAFKDSPLDEDRDKLIACALKGGASLRLIGRVMNLSHVRIKQICDRHAQ